MSSRSLRGPIEATVRQRASEAIARAARAYKVADLCRLVSAERRHVCRCRLSSRQVYFPIDSRPPRNQKASGNVGQAGAGNICRFVAAGGRGRLILCSRRLPLADALPHSLRPRRGPLRSLLPIALARSEFLSVDAGPRDNRTAGACRSRHRGGGREGGRENGARRALREAAAPVLQVCIIIMRVTRILTHPPPPSPPFLFLSFSVPSASPVSGFFFFFFFFFFLENTSSSLIIIVLVHENSLPFFYRNDLDPLSSSCTCVPGTSVAFLECPPAF